ncbi:MAG: asparagine synthase [Aromatoleum sp.]|nr:asparagine synthase [Aromatoleum sp.]
MSNADRFIGVTLEGPGWATAGSTQARGHAHLDDRFLTAVEIARVIDECPSDEVWCATVGKLNGCFALVSRRAGAVMAAVDRLRSIPLFYRVADAGGEISDNALSLRDRFASWTANPAGDAEFQLTGYVTGGETLVNEVRQLQAGEMLRWDVGTSSKPERRRYHEFRHGDYFRADAPELIERLVATHERVFRRLANGASGRTLVVPLSGGYDSRLIGVSLRDLGLRDVICYSYGLPGNWESRISQELARYLGFRWEFVPYSAERWRAWAASERFAQYFRKAGNLASIPHIQDWPAVAELQRAHAVPPDSIFVPGHSGDFLAGSHIPRDFLNGRPVSRRALLDALQRAHYSLWDWPAGGRSAQQAGFDRRIEGVIGAVPDGSPDLAADLFERWDLQERQAKFICNSMRVYEDFGYEWRLPLFDHELMDFWARVPVEMRVGRSLYFQFAAERQHIPVTSPNTDRNVVARGLVRGMEMVGLMPLAKRARRLYRRLRWRREYEASSLGWFAVVDSDYFRRTYTGHEIVHSYVALASRNVTLSESGGRDRRQVLPAIRAS